MSDVRSSPSFSTRGVRIGVVSVLVALAFLLGLALAVVLVRHQNAREAAAVDAAATLPVANPTSAPVAPVQPNDPAMLSQRVSVLAGQVAALEARSAALGTEAQRAGGQATRAEALLTVVTARRMLDRGQGLGTLDGQLLARFGTAQPRAVAIVRAAARQPVTLEDLRQGLDAIGPVAATGAAEGWVASLRHELGHLVVLRRAETPSPLPADHLARARRLMAADQVEAARAEIALLPGAADATTWMSAARRYVVARQALDVLENAALAGPAPATPLP